MGSAELSKGQKVLLAVLNATIDEKGNRMFIIDDKAKVHLLMYLVQEKAGINLGYKFEMIYGAPYSSEVEKDLENLAKKGLIRILPVPSRRSVELYPDAVMLTKEGAKVAEEVSKEVWEELKNTLIANPKFLRNFKKYGLEALLTYLEK